MRAIKFFTVSVAASPLLRTVAHASDAAGVSEGSAGKSEASLVGNASNVAIRSSADAAA
jgi:hypothetical protein